MPKNKPNKGLLKRIQITKSGKIKFRRAFGRHLRSHKNGKTMRSYRKPIYAKAGEVRRVRALLFTKVKSSAHTSATKKTDPVAEETSKTTSKKTGKKTGKKTSKKTSTKTKATKE